MIVNINKNKVLKYIFKIYILLFPFTMFMGGYSIWNSIGNSYSIIFQLIGLIVILFSLKDKRIKINTFMKYIFIMVFILNISSIIMSMLLNSKLGVLYGETTYNTMLGNIVYYSQLAVIFYYNFYVYNTLKINEIKKIFDFIVIFIIILGYMQIIIIYFPQISKIYDFFNLGNIIRDSSYILAINRIPLTCVEPASCGVLLGVLIIPYILSCTLIKNKTNKYYILLILIIPIAYWTKSSTVYIAIFINFFIYIIICIIKKKNLYKLLILSYIVIILIFSNIFIISCFNSNENIGVFETIKYYLVEKVNSDENLSTIHRKSTVINNLKIFKKYPLLGVGNGNQGFYYNENLPQFAYKSPETMKFYYGEKGVVSGGAFFTAFLSGYGTLGVVLIIIFIKKSINIISIIKNKLNGLQYMYFMGSITFLFLSTISADIVGDYITIFVLSVPLINKDVKNLGGINE